MQVKGTYIKAAETMDHATGRLLLKLWKQRPEGLAFIVYEVALDEYDDFLSGEPVERMRCEFEYISEVCNDN